MEHQLTSNTKHTLSMTGALSLFLIVTQMTLPFSHAELSRVCYLGQSSNGKCGNKLAQAVRLVCDSDYYSSSADKRSLDDELDLNELTEDIIAKNSAFMRKENALSFLGVDPEESQDLVQLFQKRSMDKTLGGVQRKGNFWQGVVCECCHHKCHIKEYCAYCTHKHRCLDNYGK